MRAEQRRPSCCVLVTLRIWPDVLDSYLEAVDAAVGHGGQRDLCCHLFAAANESTDDLTGIVT